MRVEQEKRMCLHENNLESAGRRKIREYRIYDDFLRTYQEKELWIMKRNSRELKRL